MEEYKCIKCNKSFKQKVHLQAHENKKFSCNITKVIECEHCKKKFTITTTLKSHLILCKVKIQLDEANKLKLMEDKINTLLLTNNNKSIKRKIIINDLNNTENIITENQFIVYTTGSINNENIMELMFNGNNEFKGKKLRVTNETPKRVSVYDVISIVKNTSESRKVYKRLIIEYPEVVTNCHNIKFEGQGQKETPVTAN